MPVFSDNPNPEGLEPGGSRKESGGFQQEPPGSRWKPAASLLLEDLQALSALVGDVLLCVRPGDGVILEANAAAEQAYGYSREALLGIPFADLQFKKTGDLPGQLAAAAQNRTMLPDILQQRADGGLFWGCLRVCQAVFRGQAALLTVVQTAGQREAAAERSGPDGQTGRDRFEIEERYRSLVELSPEAIGVHSQGKIVFLNEALVKLLNAESRDQLIGLPVKQFIPPEAHEINKVMLARLANGEVLPPVEQKIIRLDGQILDVDITGALVSYAGRPAFQMVVRDITERRKAEETLRESEEKFRLLIEENSEGVILMDENGRIVEWNPKQEEITGISRDEALGQLGWDVQNRVLPLHRQTQERLVWMRARLQDMLETGQSAIFRVPFDVALNRPDGSQSCIQMNVFPIQTRRGFRIGAVLHDVTEQRRSLQALQERERQMDQIIQQMPFPVLITGPDGEILAANLAFLSLFGISSPESLVEQVNLLRQPDPRFQPWQGKILPAYQGQTVFLAEETLAFPAGGAGDQTGERVHDITIFPVLDKLGGVWRVVMIWKDATARLDTQRDLQRRLAELEALHDVSLAGTEAVNMNDLIQRVTKIVVNQLFPENFGIALFDEASQTLEYHLSSFNNAMIRIPQFPLDRGVSGRTARTRQPQRVDDVRKDPDYYKVSAGILSEICVPILIGERLIGVMNAEKKQLNAFSLSDERLLGAIAGALGVAIEKIRLLEAERNRRSELEALAEVSEAVHTAETLETMLPAVLEQIGKVLGVQGASIALLDPKDESMVFALGSGEWVDMKGIRMPRGSGVGGQVALKKRMFHSTDARNDPHLFNHRFVGMAKNLICLPLFSKGQVIGLLYIGREGPFLPTEVRMAQATANIVASAIHRVRLLHQTEQQMERLTTLRSIDLLILTSLDLNHVLELLMEKITAVLHVDAADILLLDDNAGQLLLFASHGPLIGVAQRESVTPSDDPIAWDVVASLQMQFIPDLADCESRISESAWARFAPFTSYYAVPLTAKGVLKGVLRIFHSARLDPSPDWTEFLQALARQAAIAVDNALLFQEQQYLNLRLTAAYEATIDGWSRALDQRDQETEGHSQRVTELTLRLAKRLGIHEDVLQHMRRGAQLHDIGKMGIPDQILLKAGPLTETEWITMRKHPGIARDLLSPIDFLQPALEIPFCHHEKWDGSGYPLGLKGEEIPLSARIFAVIDVWDALRSDRPYRRAWSKEQALAYIQRESGHHFDPHIVEAFIAFIEEEEGGEG